MNVRGVPKNADLRAAPLTRALAWVVVLLVVAFDLLGVWSHRDELATAWPYVVLVGCETLISATVGLLIVRRIPGHSVGWLLLVHGLLVAVVLSGDDEPVRGTFAAVLTQLGQGSWALLYVCLAIIGYVFPDGHFLSPRWRLFVWSCLAGYVVFAVAAAFDVESFRTAYPDVEPPLPGPPTIVTGVLGVAGLVAIAASLVGAVVAARVRLRRASGDVRVQMLWFAWAALSIPAGLALCWVDYWLTGGNGVITILGVTVGGSVLPLAIGVGILRYRLFDIELVLSRTLTYGALTFAVVATYAAVLGGLGALVGDNSAAGLVAVGLVAVAIQPLHASVRRRVERWVYGDRSDPYVALRRLSDRLEETPDAADVIDTVTASVAEALRVQHVAVELDRESALAGTPVDGAGRDRRHVVRVPLTYQGGQLGQLAVDVPAGRALSAADRQLLDDLARHAAVIVNAVHLTLDLQRSRARLVSAQEEERRRLRRDLHDGLGPSLAAIVLKLNAVSAMVHEPRAGTLLVELRGETKAAIGEIRRLVDDLRPPALDEVGLVAALRQKAAALSRPAGTDPNSDPPLVVDVEGPDVAVSLPAAVEVAAYRITTEAMTNVVRHSHASRCAVTLTMNGALEVCVADNGSRGWDPSRVGVGWASMRERAAELGGSCTITQRPEGGTLVRASLPIPRAPIEGDAGSLRGEERP